MSGRTDRRGGGGDVVDTGGPGAGGADGPVTVGLEINQEKYRPADAADTQIHAIVSVRVEGTAGGGRGPVLAQILAVDCSTSMSWPQDKLHAARQAAVAAIRMLPDGTPFAVIGGNETATVLYPAEPGMAAADDRTRAAAERAVHRMVAAGGTCLGAWLDLAHRLLAGQGAPVGHVLLLTDGKNEHDERMPLEGVLESCAGRFVCDAWGIGDGWDARVLLRVTSRLHGSAFAVREEAALPGEYERLMSRLLARTLPELEITVTPMAGTTVRSLKQVHPTEVALTAMGRAGGEGAGAGPGVGVRAAVGAGAAAGAAGAGPVVDDSPPGWGGPPGGSGTGDGGGPASGGGAAAGDTPVSGNASGFGSASASGNASASGRGAAAEGAPPSAGRALRFVTRAWGDESRRFQLHLSADPSGRPHGEDLQIAVVGIAAPGSQGVVLPPPKACVVHWTHDPVLSARTDEDVAYFAHHGQLGEAIAAATDAFRRGERRRAEEHLGRAAHHARLMDDARQLQRLTRVVEVEDAEAGRVTLRPGVTALDFEHLITASSHSSYGPGTLSEAGTGAGRGGGATVPCPSCARRAPSHARFCPHCGHGLMERA